MIYTTQIVRLDGLTLVASVDDAQASDLAELKGNIRQVIKKLTPNSEPRASLESANYTIHYVLADTIAYLAITERSYPKKLALTYLEDVRAEFQTSYNRSAYLDPQLRPYAYGEFDRFIERTKKTYQDSRATDNLGRLNDELKDVTQVMTKNIEDLLYRGDSLEKMGDMSSRLREDSAKYKRAAVRINWELLLKQYGPFAGLGLVILLLLVWRFW
ncbi:unnamed protein product [Zymoseptoria tritici ST99CH_1A5]|uniref:Protein transport protein SEC22 n=2 Tax=Zymoseptoria tritici TaxID=1047171 RepID=A0A1X7RLK4_ZYMT9|nr:unnamed protein product [Zymoseptoria tritici ST99CH_3D7]SMR47879.1 unnamed protein product [Zymoseptoria tritici ST99CH_3D1]SMY21785.1 unnamed protein product [Zymoseptoria tritici ST99CH_1A5]